MLTNRSKPISSERKQITLELQKPKQNQFFQNTFFKLLTECANKGCEESSPFESLKIASFTQKLLQSSLSHLGRICISGDQFELTQNISTKGQWTFQITDLLKIAEGACLSSESMVSITAKRVAQFAKISACELQAHCNEWKRGASSAIEATGLISLDVTELDNNNNSIVSKAGSFIWKGQTGAILDNTHGRIEASQGAKFGSNEKGDSCNERVLLNDSGSIISEKTEIEAHLKHLSNHGGKISANSLLLQADQLINSNGELNGSNLVDIVTRDAINGGLIRGGQLRFIAHDHFDNFSGVIVTDIKADLRVGAWSTKSRNEKDVPLKGKIISKQGDVFIASQAPLIMSDDLIAQGLIQVVVEGQLGNRPGIIAFSERGEIHFIKNGTKGDIELANCELDASRILVQSQRGKTDFDGVIGKGGLDFQVEGDLRLNDWHWEPNEKGIFIDVTPFQSVEISNSQINGTGPLVVRSNKDSRLAQRPQKLLIKNSKINNKSFEIFAQKFYLDSTQFNLTHSFGAFCGEFFGQFSSLNSKGKFNIETDESNLTLKSFISKSSKIFLKSSKGLLQADKIALRSESDIKFIALLGHIYLSGSARALGTITGYADQVFCLDKFASRSDSDSIFAASSLNVSKASIAALGDQLAFHGKKEYLASNSTLIAERGDVFEQSGNKISTGKSYVYCNTYTSSTQYQSTSKITILAESSIDQTAKDIKLHQCLYRAQETNGLKKDSFKHGIAPKNAINIRAKESLAAASSDLTSKQLTIKGKNIECSATAINSDNTSLISQNNLRLSNVGVSSTGGNIHSAYVMKTEGNNFNPSALALRAKSISLKSCQLYVGDLTANANGIDFQQTETFSCSLNLKAERAFSIFESHFQSRGISIFAGNSGEIDRSTINVEEANFRARKLEISQSSMIFDQAQLLGEEALNLANTIAKGDQLQLNAPQIHIGEAEIAVKSKFSVQAQFLDAERVRLDVCDGSADLQIEFANLTELLAHVGKDLQLRGQILHALSCQLLVNQRFDVDIKRKIELISSATNARDHNWTSEEILLLGSYLQARKEILLKGQKSLWLQSELSAQQNLHAEFAKLEIKGGQQSAEQLAISAKQLQLTGTVQLAQEKLALDAAQLAVSQSILQGGIVALKSKALEVMKSMIRGDQKIDLAASDQRIIRSSLHTQGNLNQIAQKIVELENFIHAGSQLQLASQSIFEKGQQRQVNRFFMQLAPFVRKTKSCETAGLIAEIGLLFQKSKGQQNSSMHFGLGGAFDFSDMACSARDLMLTAGGVLRGDRAILDTPNFGEIASIGNLSLVQTTLRGGRLKAFSLFDSLNAKESVWRIKDLSLSAQQILDLIGADVDVEQLRGSAKKIDNRRGLIAGRSLHLLANEQIDNREGVIKGLFQLAAPQILYQNGILIPTHLRSIVEAADFQSNEQSTFVGFGDLNLNLQNGNLKGRFSLEGLLELNLNNDRFRNEASIESDRFKVASVGEVHNQGNIVAREGSMQIAGAFTNDCLIEGEEVFTIDAAKIHQANRGSIVAKELKLHQRSPLITSQLGDVIGNQSKNLSSDAEVLVDAREETPGALQLLSRLRAGSVKTHAPVIANGAVEFEGSEIEVNDRFHTQDRATFMADGQVATRKRATAAGDLNIKAHEYRNDAGEVEIKGRAHVRVNRFVNQSHVLEENQGHRSYRDYDGNHPDATPFKSERAQFKTGGGWDIEASESALNSGGEMTTAGDAQFAGTAPHNENLTHDYTYRQYVGDQKKFRPHRLLSTGSAHKRIPIYESRTQMVVDCAAVLQSRQNLVFNDLTGDLINEGIVKARNIYGRTENLTLKLLQEKGRGPNYIEPSTGLPLATMLSENDVDLEVHNKAIIQGALTAGNNLELLTRDLEVGKRKVQEMSALIRKGGLLQSDRVRFAPTLHVEEGGNITSGRHNRVHASETAQFAAATFKAGGDLDVQARNLNALSIAQSQRVSLPGKSSLFRGRNLHALHTDFHVNTFEARGLSQVTATEHLVNEASIVKGAKGAYMGGQTADHRVMSAVNQVREDRRLFRSKDQSEAVVAAPRVISGAGDAQVQTKGDLKFTGAIVAGPDHTASAVSQQGSVYLQAHSQALLQKESKTRAGFLSVSHTREKRDEARVLTSMMAGGNVVISAKNELRAEGAQFNAIKVIALKAKKISLDPHYRQQRICKRGLTLGVSFSGFSILQGLAQGQDLDQLVEKALLSDPAIGGTYNLIKAKTGEERAYRGLKAAAAYWQTANAFSLASDQHQPLSTFIGQRAGLLNGAGQLAPKMTVGLEAYQDVQEITDLFLCQLSAGEEIIVESAEQDYTATQMSAPVISLTGHEGQKAEQINFKSALNLIYSSHDSANLGMEFQTGPGASSSPTDITLAISQSDASQKMHQNSELQTSHLHVNTDKMGVQGANIHAQTASGQIDKLVLQSRLDESESSHQSASISTSGRFSAAEKELSERKIAQPSSFILEQPSSLQIEHLENTAGIEKNLNPKSATHHNLEESRKERGFNISGDMREIGRALKTLRPSKPSQNQKGDGLASLFAQDPRSQNAIAHFGDWEWDNYAERNEARATAVGTSAKEGVNDDPEAFRGPLKVTHSKGGIPFAVVDQGLVRDQAKAMFKTTELPKLTIQEQDQKEQIARKVEANRLKPRDESDLGDEILAICSELDEMPILKTSADHDSVDASHSDQAPDDGKKFSKVLEDLQFLRSEMQRTSKNIEKIERQFALGQITQGEKQERLRSNQIESSLARINYLNRQSMINQELFRTAQQLLDKNFNDIDGNKWDQLRDKLMTSQVKIDEELLLLRNHTRFIQREIIEKFDHRELLNSTETLTDQQSLQNERFLQEIFQLEGIQALFDQTQLKVSQRNLIRDVFSEVKGKEKAVIEAQILFDLPRFATIYSEIYRQKEKGKYVNADLTIVKLASDHNISPQAAKALWDISQSRRGEMIHRELSRQKLSEENLSSLSELKHSYRMGFEKDFDLSRYVEKFQWSDEIKNYADSLGENLLLEDSEKRALISQRLSDLISKDPKCQGLTAASKKSCFSFYMNYATEGVDMKQEPTGMTKEGQLFFGNFEAGRSRPSGAFYFAANKSAQEARNSYRLPSKLRVIYIGGVSNSSPSDYHEIMKRLSIYYDGKTIQAIFNSSGGYSNDAKEALKGITQSGLTMPVLQLIKSIQEGLRSTEDGAIHIIAHSQGCIHLKYALSFFEDEDRKRLQLSLIAPAAYIPEELCPNARHYVRDSDRIVQLCLNKHLFTGKVSFVSRHPEATEILDHSILSPSYGTAILDDCERLKIKFDLKAEILRRDRAKKLFELTNGQHKIKV